jgi:hypothetical protein
VVGPNPKEAKVWGHAQRKVSPRAIDRDYSLSRRKVAFRPANRTGWPPAIVPLVPRVPAATLADCSDSFIVAAARD